MASIENSLKYESEVEPGKVRLISSGEFVRAYNHSAWLFYCCISKYKVIRKYSKFYRTYPATRSLRRMRGRLKSLDRFERPSRIQSRVNSMLGVLSHYDCYQMRKVMVYESGLREFGHLTDDCLKFYPDMLQIAKFQKRTVGGIK